MKHPRIWAAVAAVLAIAATILTRVWWLGTDDWAGLGQWVGGLGSFAAVAVALWLAGAESRRERDREFARGLIHPYYVVATMERIPDPAGLVLFDLRVTNLGTEPVRDVEIVALYVPGEGEPIHVRTVESPRPALVPGHPWTVPWEPASEPDRERYVKGANDFRYFFVEIEFTDLVDRRWHRLGNDAPTQVSGGKDVCG